MYLRLDARQMERRLRLDIQVSQRHPKFKVDAGGSGNARQKLREPDQLRNSEGPEEEEGTCAQGR